MDIPCSLCMEPWDAYGVFHGDMKGYERDLFLAAAGCPCCEGSPIENVNPDDALLAQAKSVIHGAWDDPHVFASVNYLGLPFIRPEWKRPDDPVWFQCECGSTIKQNIDSDKCELYWNGGKYSQLYNHTQDWDDILNKLEAYDKFSSFKYPENWTLNDKSYCPACVECCGECGELCLNDELFLPEGSYQLGSALCETCYEEHTCSECHCKLDITDDGLCSDCESAA